MEIVASLFSQLTLMAFWWATVLYWLCTEKIESIHCKTMTLAFLLLRSLIMKQALWFTFFTCFKAWDYIGTEHGKIFVLAVVGFLLLLFSSLLKMFLLSYTLLSITCRYFVHKCHFLHIYLKICNSYMIILNNYMVNISLPAAISINS